jgi:hypothetical protein
MIGFVKRELTNAVRSGLGVYPDEKIIDRANAEHDLVFRRRFGERGMNYVYFASVHRTPKAANSCASARTSAAFGFSASIKAA